MRGNISEEYIKNAVRFLREDVEDEVPTSVDDNPGVPGVEDEFELDDPDGEGEAEECVDCPDCGGTGVITDEEGNEVTCETCGGEGCVALEDAEFDFDPSTGVCPCCGCKLNLIEPEEDSLAGEDDVEDDLDDIGADDLDEV
jgi:hypothetical protein